MLECVVCFPDFPDLASQIRTWCKGWFARNPAGGRDLTGGDNMLEGLDLADQLHNIASNLRSHHFHGTDVEIRVDEETPADVHTGIFIIDTIHAANASTCIRQQREGYATLDHFRKFFFLPDFVGETAIGRNREDFNT